jgi:hypothetical protein
MITPPGSLPLGDSVHLTVPVLIRGTQQFSNLKTVVTTEVHMRVSAAPSTGCSKSHATHGLLGICVSCTPHFKEIVSPRSPDLSPPDLFLWGHLKDAVYSNHPHTLQKLQANIQRTVDSISTGTLQNVFANMIRRVHLCEDRNGGHFQHIL